MYVADWIWYLSLYFEMHQKYAKLGCFLGYIKFESAIFRIGKIQG